MMTPQEMFGSTMTSAEKEAWMAAQKQREMAERLRAFGSTMTSQERGALRQSK